MLTTDSDIGGGGGAAAAPVAGGAGGAPAAAAEEKKEDKKEEEEEEEDEDMGFSLFGTEILLGYVISGFKYSFLLGLAGKNFDCSAKKGC